MSEFKLSEWKIRPTPPRPTMRPMPGCCSNSGPPLLCTPHPPHVQGETPAAEPRRGSPCPNEQRLGLLMRTAFLSHLQHTLAWA